MKRSRYVLTVLLVMLALVVVLPGALAADDGAYEIKGLTTSLLEDNAVTVNLQAEGSCTLVLALYNENNAMLDVKTVDISGSADVQNMHVPFSKSFPQHFVVKAFIINKVSGKPLCKSKTFDNLASSESAYAVTSLSVVDGDIVAAVSTLDECLLEVEVLSEDKSLCLAQTTAEAEAGLEMADLAASLDGSFSFPVHFVLRARLTDSDENALCDYYVTIKYTSAYKAFENQTPADFADSVVLDFGDSGYGVLADDVRVVNSIAVANADYSTFTFSYNESISSGEVILLTDTNGVKTPVKVGSVQKNSDGTYTVTRDENTTVSDLYKVFKLDATVDVGAASNQGGNALLREKHGDDSSIDYVKIETGFSAGPLNVSVSGSIGLVIKTIYDPALFGEDYIEFETYTKTSLTAEATLTAGISSSDLVDAFGNPIWPEFTVYKGPIYLVGTGIAGANLEISFPLEFEFEAGGRIKVEFNTKSGYSYNSNSGQQPIKSNETTTDFQIMGRFEIKWGPKIGLEVFVFNGLLEGEISGQIGLVAKGEVVHSFADSTTGSKTHACKTCLDIELDVFYNIKGDLHMEVSEKCKANLIAVDLLSGEHDLGKAYLSLENEEASLFNGQITFGWGICPNYKYRVIVNTVDVDKKTVTGVGVNVTGEHTDEESVSTCTFYLYDGDYTASADFDSGTFKKTFTVDRQAMTVTVSEAETRLKGLITDEKTGAGLGGATVNILWSDGSTNSTTADANGNYDFLISPRESGTITFDAANYSKLTQPIEVTPGEENTLNAQLKPAFEVKFTVIKTDGNTASGLSILGTGLDKTPVTGTDGTVTVELAGDEYTFSTSNSQSSAYTTVTVDADMEITLTLQENYMQWRFDEPTSTLFVWGLGPMPSYNSTAPWAAHISAIQHVDITGMSEIGTNAFKNHTALKTVKLPDTLTKINSDAFNGCTSLKEIIIPDEVVTIGAEAFKSCIALGDVTFGKKVKTIDNSAFQQSGITKFEAPESLESINNSAFTICSSLVSVTIPGSENGTFISMYAFEACTALKTVEIGGKVTTIGDYSFRKCTTLEDLTIEYGVEKINTEAFYNCTALGAVTIPGSVKTISSRAFAYCSSLGTVTVSPGVESIKASAFSYSGVQKINLPSSITEIDNYAFYQCDSLTSVSVSGNEEETKIYTGSFEECNALQSVVLGSGVTYIGSSAFHKCNSLSSLTLSPTLVTIGANAFQGCTSLGYVPFPNSVITIGNSAFQGCTELSSVLFGSGVEEIGASAFADSGLTGVNIPESVKTIGNYAFQNCKSLLSAVIAANSAGTNINTSAFKGCEALWSVSLGEGVKNLGDSAFMNCKSLGTITLPNSLMSMGRDAFNSCEALAEVIFGSGLESIGASAFANSGLASVQVPSNVKTIGNCAFENCNNLKVASVRGHADGTEVSYGAFNHCDTLVSITLDSNVTAIGDNAFDGCVELRTINFGSGVKSIGAYAFEGCKVLGSVSIPSNVLTIGNGAFNACEELSSVTIGSGVTTIGSSAFSATALTSVYVPSNVTSIGNGAFSSCKSLTYASIAGNENGTTLGSSVFSYCDKLASISIGVGVTKIGSSAFASCKSLSSVSYAGSSSQWAAIDIGSGNDYLLDAYGG